MLFSILLLSCLTHNRTLEEGGAKIAIRTARPNPGEIYLFFNTLERPGSRSPLRSIPFECPGSNSSSRSAHSTYEGPLCDGIVLHTNKEYEKKIICLVELKTGRLRDAERQIICTKKFLEKYIHKYLRDTIIWKAHIHISGGAPRDLADIEKELTMEFGKGNYSKSREENLCHILVFD